MKKLFITLLLSMSFICSFANCRTIKSIEKRKIEVSNMMNVSSEKKSFYIVLFSDGTKEVYSNALPQGYRAGKSVCD